MDNFLSQHVLALKGQWITRREAIKYMANVASGVHSGVAKEAIDKTIARIRLSARYSAQPNTATISFNLDSLYPTEPEFRYDPGAIDPVLVEALATAHFLAISPDIIRLQSLIHSELAARG